MSASSPFPLRLLVVACLILGALPLLAVGPAPEARPISAGPDPREIPLPTIACSCTQFPGVSELSPSEELPDIMKLNSGRPVLTAADWALRRQEMRNLLQHYATGHLPPAPGNVTGELISSELLSEGRVRYQCVRLRFGPGKALSLEIGLFLPADGKPHPVIIVPGATPPGATTLARLPQGPTQGKGVNVLMPSTETPKSLPPTKTPKARSAQDCANDYGQALERGYGIALFNTNDCAEDTTLRREDGSFAFRHTRFLPAYPGYDWGVLAAWAWGASRIADYLETEPLVDAAHLIVTGVSRTGKSAMIAAAFDERLMAAPVVTGGGGIGVYRHSGVGRGGREGLGEMMNKYPNWFGPRLREFWGHTEQLPFDQHWFVALCAPRPFIALEGETDTVSLPNAVKTSLAAALPAYRLLGVEGRLGLNYGAHGHAFTAEDWTALLDFADQQYLGRTNARDFSIVGAGAAIPGDLGHFDVRKSGALGDGVQKDTAAFQRALDLCAISGGGEVFVPAGKYLIGSIQLGKQTTLRLAKDAVLLGSPDLADYPMIDVRWEGRWQPGHRALIHAANVDGIGIVGPGRIEGNPQVAASQNPRGALVLEANHCNGVLWDGFTVIQGGNWATHPTYCTNVIVRNLTIRGARDGIDIDSCSRVRIEACDIDTGDDCISLKSGRGRNGAREGRPTEDVVITDCLLRGRHFACIGIGSEVSSGVRRVSITRTTFVDSKTHAIYIKSRVGRAGVIEDIVGSELTVQGGSFLRVNLSSAGNTNTVDDPVEGDAGIPLCRGLRFSQVKVACKTLAEVVQIPEARPLLGLVLEDIEGTCASGISLRNVSRVRMAGLKLAGYAGPLISAENSNGEGLEGASPLPANTKR